MDFIYKRKINYYETDRMGIVHHSNYIRFLEESRSYWLENANIPMGKLESLGYTIPTLEVYCKYIHHVTVGDNLLIKPIMEEYNGVRMKISYEVIDEKTNRKVIDAWTTHCFTSRELRPVNMKKHNPEINDIFENL